MKLHARYRFGGEHLVLRRRGTAQQQQSDERKMKPGAHVSESIAIRGRRLYSRTAIQSKGF
jgi:hypothetical protein